MLIVAGACALIAAGWVGFSGVAGIEPGRAGEIDGGVALKTKLHRERVRRGEQLGAREALSKKRKEGMTDREVGWIVRDFLALGLDAVDGGTSTPEVHLDLRRKRGEWFLKAIGEAFSLSGEQIEEARISIRAMEDAEFAELSEYLRGKKPFTHEGKQYMIVSGHELNKFAEPSIWLDQDGYQPWNLCGLSAEQSEVTWQSETEASEGEPRPTRVEFTRAWKDMATEGGGGGQLIHDVREHYLLEGARIIPFGFAQIRPVFDALASERPISALNLLHPAQLRLALLHSPGRAEEIFTELNRSLDGSATE